MSTGPAVGLPSFDEVTDTELRTVPQVACVVGLVMCTEALAPDARLKSAPPQVSTPPAMPQVQPPLTWSKDQLRPASVGRVSLITTPWAVPSPPLVTVIV